MDELHERIMELEIRSSHQERLLEELSGIVAEYSRRVVALERENYAFREMLGSLAPDSIESPDE